MREGRMGERVYQTDGGEIHVPEALGEPLPVKGCGVDARPDTGMTLMFYVGPRHLGTPGSGERAYLETVAYLRMTPEDFQRTA
jgi:hypothetical protein